MSWSNVKGFIFVDAGTGVTPGTNETLVVGSSNNLVAYPVSKTIDGDTFNVGYSVGGGNDGARDRGTTPVHQAGVHFTSNGSGNQKSFRIDVPAGTYNVRLCIGDQSSDHTNNYVQILNNASALTTISVASLTGGQYIDATGVTRTSASDWETNNAAFSANISSGILIVKFGDPVTASDATAITFLSLVAAGGTTITPSAGSLALTGKQPTVSLSGSTTISLTAGAFSFIGQQPVQTLTVGAAVPGTLAFAGLQPAVIQGAVRQPSAATLAISGQTPSLLTPRTITPSVGSLGFTGKQAGVVLGPSVTITPLTGTLSITGNAASLIFSSPNIRPTPGSLVFTGLTPTVVAIGGGGSVTGSLIVVMRRRRGLN